MRHLKRQNIPSSWPIPRKGTTFVVRPNSANEKGLPILVILRDILKVAKDRKEVKKALFMKNVLINGRLVRDEKNSGVLFDTITIIPSKKSYRIVLDEKGKFSLEEIKESENTKKVSKIINKVILKGKKIQLNLSDGRNLLYEHKCNVGDSVLINLKDKKIEKIIQIKEKSKVIIYSGKHSGKQGEVIKLKPERKMVSVQVGKEKINVLTKQIMAIE